MTLKIASSQYYVARCFRSLQRGANCPTIQVPSFMEGFVSTGCAFLRETARSEREGELRGLLQLMVHQEPIAIVPIAVPKAVGV